MAKRINANLIINIKLLDDRTDVDLINDIMCRVNSSVRDLRIIAGYVRYDKFDIEEEENIRSIKIKNKNRTVKLNENKMNQMRIYEKNKEDKRNNCEVFR